MDIFPDIFLMFIEQTQDITWIISGRKHKQKTRTQNTKTHNTIVQVTSRKTVRIFFFIPPPQNQPF
jgi:hypothetical protein